MGSGKAFPEIAQGGFFAVVAIHKNQVGRGHAQQCFSKRIIEITQDLFHLLQAKCRKPFSRSACHGWRAFQRQHASNTRG